jgi:predicted lipoprotein with Yx(FWY)xxD motif
MHLPKHL